MAGAASVSALLGLLTLVRTSTDYVSLTTDNGQPCGRRRLVSTANDVRRARIIGGLEADMGEYPWLVSIQVRHQHLCGGSLISRHLVLSAGHCFNGRTPAQLSVVSGEYDLTTSVESRQRRHSVEALHVHINYRPPSFANDIALIQLAQPVDSWDDWRQPVCLPRPDMKLPAGRSATVAGWGWTAEPKQGGRRSDVVRHVTVPLLSESTCSSWFRQANQQLSLHAGQICAGVKAGGRDGCSGDSGGPLVVADTRDQHTHIQVGVVSAGLGCGRPNLPGIYTDLRHYMVWIVQTANRIEHSLTKR